MAVTIDSAPPTVTVPDLASASDSGRSTTDNITRLTTLTFSGTAEIGATIRLMDGSVVIGTTVAARGSWSIIAAALGEGVHSISARAADVAGNQASSSTLVVTIDATNPTISAPDLSPASDSGESDSDNVTRIATPVFSGFTEAGATVTLLEGGQTLGTAAADGAGNWSITAKTLASGTHTITARATDAAGNVSAISAALVVTIDTTPPFVSKPDLTPASDTGASSTDNSTSIVTPTFAGTGEAGATVTLLEGSTVLGAATATGGVWTITSTALANSAHNITARATDRAGNQTTSTALTVTIDASPVTVSTPDLVASSDTGASNSDNITRLTTLTFTGPATAGATVALLEGSKVLASAVATNGVWTITASALSAGAHNLSARATDLAGNQATSAALVVTIDTTPPAISVPQLITPVHASNASNAMSIATLPFTSTNSADFQSPEGKSFWE